MGTWVMRQITNHVGLFLNHLYTSFCSLQISYAPLHLRPHVCYEQLKPSGKKMLVRIIFLNITLDILHIKIILESNVTHHNAFTINNY
jgi:hypothetical protein